MDTKKLRQIIGLIRKLEKYGTIPLDSISVEGMKITVTQMEKAPVKCWLERRGFKYSIIEDNTFCSFDIEFSEINPKQKKSFEEVMKEIAPYLPVLQRRECKKEEWIKLDNISREI